MLLHGDAEIARQVAARWGAIRTTTPREKEGKIKAVSIMLTRGKGDLPSGHKLFVKHCSICHRLYGEGNQIGPDLTAADRKNLSVLLPNVIDPSAVIRPEFRCYNVVLDDGRILSGLLADSNNSTVTVLDAKNQRTVVKRADVEELKVSDDVADARQRAGAAGRPGDPRFVRVSPREIKNRVPVAAMRAATVRERSGPECSRSSRSRLRSGGQKKCESWRNWTCQRLRNRQGYFYRVVQT